MVSSGHAAVPFFSRNCFSYASLSQRFSTSHCGSLIAAATSAGENPVPAMLAASNSSCSCGERPSSCRSMSWRIVEGSGSFVNIPAELNGFVVANDGLRGDQIVSHIHHEKRIAFRALINRREKFVGNLWRCKAGREIFTNRCPA